MEDVVLQLHQQVTGKRYGKFRGFVVDNKDPEKRGRLKLKVPSALGDQETDWALPCLPFGGASSYGLFLVPELDAQIWVEFEEGDLHRPIWTGTFWQADSGIPEDAAKGEPTTRLLQTPSGHILQFDDEADQERFRLHHPADAEVVIDKNGSISLTDASGARLELDADGEQFVVEDAHGNTITTNRQGTTIEDTNGNTVEMNSSGITVEGTNILVKGDKVDLGGLGGESLIKGESFLSMFASHTHTVAPVVGGPTSPPIPQGEQSALSTTVKTT